MKSVHWVTSVTSTWWPALYRAHTVPPSATQMPDGHAWWPTCRRWVVETREFSAPRERSQKLTGAPISRWGPLPGSTGQKLSLYFWIFVFLSSPSLSLLFSLVFKSCRKFFDDSYCILLLLILSLLIFLFSFPPYNAKGRSIQLESSKDSVCGNQLWGLRKVHFLNFHSS